MVKAIADKEIAREDASLPVKRLFSARRSQAVRLSQG